MFKLDQRQFDSVIIDDTDKLAEIAADDIFAKDEFYSDMPFEIRKLLAEYAVEDARKHGMNTLPSIFGFVQTMVAMTPRFSVMEPFKRLLARADLSPDAKMERIMADDMEHAWIPILKHVDDHNDWHQNYWDERVDWSRVDHLTPTRN